jgi:hypothetical protein
VEGLGGGHINSIGKRSNDKTWSITEILVTIDEGSVSNSKLELLLFLKEVYFKLGLPLELLSRSDLAVVENLNNITGVSVHSNHATNLLTHRF